MGHTLGATRNDVDDDDDDDVDVDDDDDDDDDDDVDDDDDDDDGDDDDDDDEDGTSAVHTPLSQSKIFNGIGKNRYWSVIIILS